MDAELFAAALVEWEAALDWERLGRLYCHEGGETFFPPEQREAVRDAGLKLADDLARGLERLPPGGVARSLWVGAGVAELAPILCDAIVLGRDVAWCNLLEEEVDELARAAAVAEARLGAALPRARACGPAEVGGDYDHLWLVSVLSDPETFPRLSATLYGRSDERGAAWRAERDRAAAVLDDALAGLVAPAVLVTTEEELALVGEGCRRRGLELAVPRTGRLSGVVGDVVLVCGVR